MRLSLTKKFIIGYLIFAIASFLIIAFFTGSLAYDVCAQQMFRQFKTAAESMASDMADEDIQAVASDASATAAVSYAARYMGARIWLVDEGGKVVYDSKKEASLTGALIWGYDTLSTQSYQIGHFYGLINEQTFSVAEGLDNGGAIVIHTPVAQLRESVDDMTLPVYITFVLIFLCSFIIFVMIQYFVDRPLKVITKGASEYASGNLQHEIPKLGDDEIGYLASTLNYMAQELEASEQYQKRFVANVSHDFRSPLTSIKGYLEAMADGTIPPESAERYIRIVINETERLNNLTQSLLSLDSLDRGNMHLEMSEFDILGLIMNVCDTFVGVCGQKGIALEVRPKEGTITVRADMGKIQQVLHNLIDNAIKFSAANSSIEITVRPVGVCAFVSVRDHGIGIDAKDLKKIWTRFYKTDESRGMDRKGTGLGLSIVKEIIQAHGQTIDVVSTRGIGTEFTFRLAMPGPDSLI